MVQDLTVSKVLICKPSPECKPSLFKIEPIYFSHKIIKRRINISLKKALSAIGIKTNLTNLKLKQAIMKTFNIVFFFFFFASLFFGSTIFVDQKQRL